MLLRMIRENPYGWLVVAVLFTVLSLVMSARSALGLLIPEWEAEFAWDPHVHLHRRFRNAHGDGDRLADSRNGARPLRGALDLRGGDSGDRHRGLPDRGHVGRLAFHRRVRADRRDRLLDDFPPR